MTSEADILRLVASLLEGASIPYMLSGSMALNFYATPRMTRDIDIVVQIESKDVEKIVRIFSPEFYVDEEMIRGAIRDGIPFNVIHLSSVTKTDLIPLKPTKHQRTALKRRKFLDFGGRKIAVITAEDLILSKLFWAKDSLSEVQLRDVRCLLDKSSDLDMAYVDEWVRKLGLLQPLSKAKK